MATRHQMDMSLGDLIIQVDTREKNPYKFQGRLVVVDTLSTGDYSIKGLADLVAIERKQFGDFLSCCIAHRQRFQAEMQRMQAFQYKMVVIETDYTNIARGTHPRHKNMDPSVAVGTIASLVARGIPVMCAGDRKKAEAFTLRFLERVYLMVRGMKRER